MRMRKLMMLTLLVALTFSSCGSNKQPETSAPRNVANTGDKMIYGLACDGSNDTIVVFLREPYNGAAPDTLNILEASQRHLVFGTLRIGDEVAMMRDTVDSTRANIIIVTQDLLGQWCYKAKPTLRRKAGDSTADAGGYGVLPDSIRQLLNEEREYGFALKIDSVALTIGLNGATATDDEESPVEYPRPTRYRQWYISNGQLMLVRASTDSVARASAALVDTATFVRLTADTLVLRFANEERGFYRRTE